MPNASPAWAFSNSHPATAASSACWIAKMSCWRWPGAVEIASFLEAARRPLEGDFDLSLVEGSISSPEQLEQMGDAGQGQPARCVDTGITAVWLEKMVRLYTELRTISREMRTVLPLLQMLPACRRRWPV